MDVMEIDGASNRGIDQIRELKSHVGLSSFTGGAKVYILDEVHMLTAEAFNALLKTLEEPPPSVMFIFATTEPHKVPVTIRSRCQHIPFHRISAEDMVAQLKRVAASEGFGADEGALWEIARSADGALRDALSLAEQAVAAGEGKLSLEAVKELFGGSSRMEMERFVAAFRTSPRDASATMREMLDKGVSPERFLDALFPLIRDMWVFALWGEPALSGTSLSGEERDFIRSEAPHWDASHLKRAAMTCASMFSRARMGLRAEIFSGLLFFELSSIFQDECPDYAAPTAHRPEPAPRPARREPATDAAREIREEPGMMCPPRPAAAPVERDAGRGTDVKTPGAAKAEPEGPDGSAELAELTKDLPHALALLCADNLPMAAALIDVKVTRGGDGLTLDFSEASPQAKVILTSPRAKFALERAFGMREERTENGGAQQTAPAAPDGRPSSPMAPRAMTTEAISAYLGADILMSKHIASDDEAEEPSDIADS
jgi:DNA polymerase-3 subunit gamma/tau